MKMHLNVCCSSCLELILKYVNASSSIIVTFLLYSFTFLLMLNFYSNFENIPIYCSTFKLQRSPTVVELQPEYPGKKLNQFSLKRTSGPDNFYPEARENKNLKGKGCPL
ncbi:hypothetical protein KUF71_001144 [Frankliniella fusca]|uniref:Uncharacterized protein n=1 Tax=Frankliniella fusca TaxID=407009 RepID=A0AAE1HFJ3_9NEOP|nr:hypothetical protein KUF71_001144 [Frankliniella fusca]